MRIAAINERIAEYTAPHEQLIQRLGTIILVVVYHLLANPEAVYTELGANYFT